MRVPCLLILMLALGQMTARAGDWLNWRGPNHDGVSQEKLPDDLDSASIAWRAEVGTGFSTVSVAGKRVLTMGNVKDQDIVWCLDATTGKPLWKHRYACALDPRYYEGGPGGTPTIEPKTNSVYTMSKKGHAFCLDLESGDVRWSRDLRKEYELELPEWSFACSPFLAEDLVILNVGSTGWALDKKTGKTVWSSGKTRSGYATPVPLRSGALLIFSASELVTLSPDSGKVSSRHAWKSSRDINASDPIVSGSRALISSSTGAALLEWPDKGGAPKELWKNRNLRTYFNAGVLHEGHVYAIHGTTHSATDLICLDWKTGNPAWSKGGFGSGALMAAGGGNDMILLDKGQLTIFRGTPEKFISRLQLQVLGGKCWTAPVLSNGRIYCRNAKGQLACVRLN